MDIGSGKNNHQIRANSSYSEGSKIRKGKGMHQNTVDIIPNTKLVIPNPVCFLSVATGIMLVPQ